MMLSYEDWVKMDWIYRAESMLDKSPLERSVNIVKKNNSKIILSHLCFYMLSIHIVQGGPASYRKSSTKG